MSTSPRRLETRIVPLASFESEVDSVDFGNGCALATLTEKELRMVSADHIGTHFGRGWLAEPRYKLVTAASGGTPTNHDSATNDLVVNPDPPVSALEVIRAMRLCHGGNIIAPIFIDYNPGENMWGSGGLLSSHPLGAPYRFRQGDVGKVQKFVAMLMSPKCRSDNRLNNAFRRFDDVHARSRTDDQILDCFTALESCLTPDSTTEVGYRLAFRTAAILSRSSNPKEVQLLIGAGYEARSKIVHEGQSLTALFANNKGSFKKRIQRLKALRGLDTEINSITEFSFTDELIECLRRVLETVVAALSGDCPNVETFVNKLDEEIAAALANVAL